MKKTSRGAGGGARTANGHLDTQTKAAVEWLERRGTKAGRDGMARYAIPSDRAFGVPMRTIQALAKQLGKSHALADALWKTGWYEARLLACYVDEPEAVTPAQMDRWCREFDNWAVCDTACFVLFDRTPHAWDKVEKWSQRREEFIKRAAFALLWGLTVHDKKAADERFTRALTFVERAAADDRNFVKKAVNMSLRAIGKRNRALNAAAVAVGRRLAASGHTAAQWVGKDAVRELTSAAMVKRLAARRSKAS